MMIGKQMQRIMSGFMCLVLMLSMFISPTYAWDTSAGGDGNFGTVGPGNWDNQMQGIRITILAPDGKPAFAYGSDKHPGVDILYSNMANNSIDRMIGSCKALEAINGEGYGVYDYGKPYGDLVKNSGEFMGDANNSSRFGIKRAIISFDWMLSWIKSGRWGFAVNDMSQYNAVMASLGTLSKTYPVRGDNGIWSVHGEEIAKLIYGDLDKTEPATNAAIHAIFNTINRQAGTAPVWQLTDSGANALGGKDNPIVQAYNNGVALNGVMYSATSLMKMGHMAIVVEPLIWMELKGNGGQRSGIWLYGTPTGIADKIKQLVDTGQWSSRGWDRGGYDISLFKASRMAFVLSKNIEYAGVTFEVPWDVQKAKTDENYYLKHDRISPKTVGWGLHIYVCGSDDGTHTWDNNRYPDSSKFTEHPAPDPAVDPPTAGKYPSDKPSCIYRIVKVYDKEVLKEGEGKSIEHVATYVRENTYSKIEIQDEIEAGG